MTNRRDFIKKGCIACLGLSSMGVLLDACTAPLQVLKFNSIVGQTLTVPADKFNGQSKMIVLRSEHLDNDILLVKNNDAYQALLLVCTHEGFALTPTETKIFCDAHGSQFDLEGKVIREPALKPLTRYKTALINNNITIYLNQQI